MRLAYAAVDFFKRFHVIVVTQTRNGPGNGCCRTLAVSSQNRTGLPEREISRYFIHITEKKMPAMIPMPTKLRPGDEN